MPLHELSVIPTDVSGSRLGLALNAPSPTPLATHRIAHPAGGALVLGVLGASHVISVENATSQFSEQISCAAHRYGDTLPERAEAPGYCMNASTTEHGEADFRGLAERLRDRCSAETDCLGGTFPGDDAALTALEATPDGVGWRWQTWHLYPGASGGTVVHTESRWRP